MLIYQKKITKPVRIISQSGTEELLDIHDIRPYMSQEFFQEILKDNDTFMFERNLYAEEFFNFYTNAIRNAWIQGVDLTVPATNFALDVVAHAYNNKMLPDLTKLLGKFYSEFPESCRALFESYIDGGMLKIGDSLLSCSEKSARRDLGDLFLAGLFVLAEDDYSDESLAKRFADGLINMIPQQCE